MAINSIAIVLGQPGPTSVSGSLNPGDEIAAYRIDDMAGERLQFHNVSTSSTNGRWSLLGENDQQVAGAVLGSDFTANLAATGPYYLELIGNTASSIAYSFQITDVSDQPIPLAGFDAPQSGTLAAGAAATFAFEGYAGLPIEFNSLSRSSSPINVSLTDPKGNSVFSGSSTASDQGPFIVAASAHTR